jgi:hypothetical protein
LGLGLAAGGVIAVFETENGTGSAALVTVGVLMVLFAAVGDRIESVKYGDIQRNTATYRSGSFARRQTRRRLVATSTRPRFSAERQTLSINGSTESPAHMRPFDGLCQADPSALPPWSGLPARRNVTPTRLTSTPARF